MSDDEDAKIFPMRLMEVLQDGANSDSIRWLAHGRAFIIHNKKLFESGVMPKFFPRKSKYSSFTRKLNRWNFTRVSSGPELGAYYHEFFLRDKPYLAAQMFCKNSRSKFAMESEPAPMIVAQTAAVPEDPLRSQPVAHVHYPAREVKPIKSSMPELTPAIIAALVKAKDPPNAVQPAASMHLNQFQTVLREQQRLLQQYETAFNKVHMLQQLMTMRVQGEQPVGAPQQLRSAQNTSSPSNPRASAA